MYLVFDLPSGAGGMAAAQVLGALRSGFKKWSEKYEIAYQTKTHKYTCRLIFAEDRDYHFFMWSWDPEIYMPRHPTWSRFRVVDPPKH
jgi:hypothetical protein